VIEVVEWLCEDLEHVAVNAGLIDTVAEAFPDEILVYSEARHGAHLRKALGNRHGDRIRWLEVAIPERRAGMAARLPREYGLLRRAAAGHGKPRLRILLSAHRSLLWALAARRAFGRDRIPTQVVLHGEVGEVAGWRSRNPLRRLFDMRSTLERCLGRRTQYLVLEHAIAERLRAEMPRIAPGVAALPHPILVSELGDASPPPVSSAIRIAFLGLATEAKGFGVFAEIAKRMAREFPRRFEFHAVGSLPPGGAGISPLELWQQPAGTQLSRTDFLTGLRAVHYVCLPFRGSHYDLAASGALLDAVANLRPVIALPTPVLTRMFATHGIGHLCQSTDEIVAVLQQLASGFHAHAYNAQVAAMTALRQDRLPRALAGPYRELTERFLHA
jgi:glycosyltransferase involved in cell wall biosynthesis